MLLQDYEGRLENMRSTGSTDDNRVESRAEVKPVQKAIEPHIEGTHPLDEARTKEVVSTLRRFHLGDPGVAGECKVPDESYLPALLNVYRGLRRFRYEYPLVLLPLGASDEETFAVSLDEYLTDAVQSFAGADSGARILKDNLAWIERFVRDRMTDHEWPVAALDLIEQAATALQEHLGLQGSNRESLQDDLDNLVGCVSPESKLLAFTPNAAFHLLHHVMHCHRVKARYEFQSKLQENIRGLKKLLAVEREKTASSDPSRLSNTVGDGARYLNTDNFSGVLRHRHQGTVSMSAERLQRITDALEMLEQFSNDDGNLIYMVIRDGSLNLEERGCFRVIESSEPCTRAMELYDELSSDRAGAYAAMRIAELEVEGKYDPAIHDSWFNNFDWEAFSDEELHLVPTVVAVETTMHAAGEQMHAVSRILNSGKPLQVAMTVSAHGNPERSDGDPLHGFRMELAWFGIGHREAVVNQTSAARAQSLAAGFSSALTSTRPSLHLIHSGFTASQPLHPWIMASAALESRAHPIIRYNPAFVDGGQIDFADNPAEEEDWVSNEFSYKDEQEETVTTRMKFTFADYCLLKPDLRDHFRCIPAECVSEDFVTVDEFLNAEAVDQDRLIPFVWSVDGEGRLQKLAVSRILMFACRDRLGFWRDLQSMAGIHNYHVDQAVTRVRAEEQARASEEKDELVKAHEEELEAVRTSASEDIMGRLTEVLMGLDLSDAALRAPGSASARAEPAEPAYEPGVEEAEAEAESQEVPSQEEEEEVSFDEPWIDTMLCTSCDDCMAINKMLFVYNEDKQAIIKDPKVGTFEQLVRAAELCPAHCIHPGKPLDPNEPGLDDLIKRAEPYN